MKKEDKYNYFLPLIPLYEGELEKIYEKFCTAITEGINLSDIQNSELDNELTLSEQAENVAETMSYNLKLNEYQTEKLANWVKTNSLKTDNPYKEWVIYVINHLLFHKKIPMNKTSKELVEDNLIKRLFIHDNSFVYSASMIFGELKCKRLICLQTINDEIAYVNSIISSYASPYTFYAYSDFESYVRQKMNNDIFDSDDDIVNIVSNILTSVTTLKPALNYEAIVIIAKSIYFDYNVNQDLDVFIHDNIQKYIDKYCLGM